MTREELVDYYGAKGESIPLTYRGETSGGYDDDAQPDMAEIYEIWDKRSGKQLFIATDHNELLEEFEDPYGLDGFWPMPEPVYAISTTDTTLPVPEIFTYEDQLQELDMITQRIANLTDALKRRGVYDASFAELQRLANATDNEFVPVDNMAMLQAGGGLANVMQEAPLDNLIKALASCISPGKLSFRPFMRLLAYQISCVARPATAKQPPHNASKASLVPCG